MAFARDMRGTDAPPPDVAITAAPAPDGVKFDKPRANTFGLPIWRQGRPYQGSWRVERSVTEGYEKVTWVFRCVNAIAKRFARIPKVYREGNPDTGGVRADHPLLDLFNVSPSPLPQHRGSPDSIARYFWQRLAAQYLLSKSGVFVEVIRRKADNLPIAMSLLPPGITSPIPGSSSGTFLDGFEVKVPGRQRPIYLPPEDVVWVRDPHPLDPYSSQTPLEPLGLTVDSDWWAKVYNRTFLQNYGRPGMGIAVHGEVSDDDADELVARMTPGPKGAGRSFVFETVVNNTDGTKGPGGGVDIIDFAKTPVELSWLEGRKAGKEEILAGFACPESVAIGNASGRTFSNADAEYVTFWLDTLPDYVAGMLQPFDILDGDPGLFLVGDFSTQREYQAVAAMRTTEGLEKMDKGGITINEFRVDYLNKEPVNGGDVIYLPANRLPIGRSASEPAPPDAPKQVDLGPFKIDERALDAVKQFADRRWRVWESSVTSQLRGFFSRQERVALAKLKSEQVLRGTRHWTGPKRDHGGAGTKQIDPRIVFNVDTWDPQLTELMEPLWVAILEDYGTSVLRSLVRNERADETDEEKADDDFNLSDPRVVEFLQDRGRKIVGVNETTRQAIVAAIAKGEAAGEGIEAIADRIRQVFAEASRLRAVTIARTELLSASNQGSVEGARQSGVAEQKVWLATSDDRTRDTHRDVDGATVALEEPFDVGGAPMMFPGDPAGPASETINCRCTLLYATANGIVL